MKHVAIALIAGAAVLAASGAEADFKKIRKEADFVAQIVGKSVVAETNTTKINADGTFSGKTTDGRRFNGVWNWQGRFWCRNGRLEGTEIGSDCQLWEIDGTRVRVTRNKGKGDAQVGKLK